MRGPWVRGSKTQGHITALLHQPAPVAARRPPFPRQKRRTEEKEGKQTHRALLGCYDSFASSGSERSLCSGSAHVPSPHCRLEVPPTSAGRRGLLPAAGGAADSVLGSWGLGPPHRPPQLTPSPPSPEVIAQRWSRTALMGLPCGH